MLHAFRRPCFIFFSCRLFVSSREGVTKWTSGSARCSAGSTHGFSTSGYATPSEPQEVPGSYTVWAVVFQIFVSSAAVRIWQQFRRSKKFLASFVSRRFSRVKPPPFLFEFFSLRPSPPRLNALLFSILCSCFTSSQLTRPRQSRKPWQLGGANPLCGTSTFSLIVVTIGPGNRVTSILCICHDEHHFIWKISDVTILWAVDIAVYNL